MTHCLEGRGITLHGLVQGVGFRPWIWHLARRLNLRGSVYNDGGGLRIEVWGKAADLTAFQLELRKNPPSPARIDTIVQTSLRAVIPPGDFKIEPSRGGAARTFILPDMATCPACLEEIFNPTQRRYHYPFTHCTDCGPRFSITRQLPYDRAGTSMACFDMCDACQSEYQNPADRRFHAQPIACQDCGPRVWLTAGDGATDDVIGQCAQLIRQGKILAVKGMGGFQLLADATQTETVTLLRERKHRPHKPFALMARDLDVIRRYGRLYPAEIEALTCPSAPIVLLRERENRGLAKTVAPGLNTLGFVIPYTPLHRLLLETFDHPLVFTSGNVSGAPLCAGNQEALAKLGGIADEFLLHDRDIVHRCDDSVVTCLAGEMRVLRLGRGCAPFSLTLPPGFENCDGIMALGGELKNSFCLLRQGQAILSQYLGDLEQAACYQLYRAEIEAWLTAMDCQPRHLAIDAHPEYLSTKWGHAWAKQDRLPLVEVMHHHAHMAACLAEHDHPLAAGPVLGLILDGLGLGTGGEIWGGELLWADYHHFRRLACLKPAPLPGGGRAMTEPWRNLVAQLWLAGMETESLFSGLEDKPVPALLRMMVTGWGTPSASSCGRLFDAVAAALGICFDRQSYEGQAAALLERLASDSDDEGGYPFAIHAGQPWMVDPKPMWQHLIRDLKSGDPPAAIASRFHYGLADTWSRLISDWSERLDSRVVVLSGGVMQNRVLVERLVEGLQHQGLSVWIPRRVPLNDGGLALGQATVAAARMTASPRLEHAGSRLQGCRD